MASSKTASQHFHEYLLEEYRNIAEAHFRTMEAISSFFRYYLTIMTLPIALYAAIIGLSKDIGQFIYPLYALSAVVSLIIAIIGLLVFLYVANLRMDALLYARTVNAIRKNFYDNAPISRVTKLNIRVLPQTASQPPYFELTYFIWVNLAFAIFNTIYLLLGLVLLSIPIVVAFQALSINGVLSLPALVPFWVWLVAGGFFFVHILAYWWAASYREHAYLRSYSLGVDIDGVLNPHEDHFCALLKTATGRTLLPTQITSIPVHDNPQLCISRSDEKKVFNNPRYWTRMPRMRGAASSIAKLHNMFGLGIHIFTYRPWPSEEIRKTSYYHKNWIDAAITMYTDSQLIVPRMLRCLKRAPKLYDLIYRLTREILRQRMITKVWRFRLQPIDLITKCWLDLNDFQYDKLTIEKGSEDISDPQGHFRNRFYISRKRKLRFFVEDDEVKASKLAYICDVVFLIKHPYNAQATEVPDNVLLVSSWREICEHIKKLS